MVGRTLSRLIGIFVGRRWRGVFTPQTADGAAVAVCCTEFRAKMRCVGRVDYMLLIPVKRADVVSDFSASADYGMTVC